MTGSIPYSLSVPKLQTPDGMSTDQFNAMMQKRFDEAKAGKGLPLDDAFKSIHEEI